MRLVPILIAAAVLAGCDSDEERARPPAPEPPPAAITRAELDEHLSALGRIAEKAGGTRAAGTPGYRASAEYVAARLRDAGWKVRVERFRFPYFDLDGASLRIDGRRFRRERDYQVVSYSGSGRATGRLSDAGDGCSAADFAGLAPGEIALVERAGCLFREKAAAAEHAGARAVLVSAETASRRGLYSGTLGALGVGIPVMLVSSRALEEVTGDAAVVRVDADVERRPAENVVAETAAGSGRALVMAGGHLDSVQGGPGINDNGSGVAALIELAEAIGPEPPGARVRLGFWAAEELGLLGSRRYVRSLERAERRRIRAYVNFDMVGSPNAVPQLYADGDPDLARVLRRSATVRLGRVLAGVGSDHFPFKAAGIPVTGIYTGGPEEGRGGRPRDPCYHLACDDLENVDRGTLLRMARTAARAVSALSAQAK